MDTALDCLYAVKDGKADCAYFNTEIFHQYAKQDNRLAELNISNIREEAGVAIAVDLESSELLSILNKSLACVSSTDMKENLIFYARNVDDVSSFQSFYKQNRVAVWVIFGSVLAIFLIVGYAYITLRRKNMVLEKQMYISQHDPLTGIYNRHGFDLILEAKKHQPAKKGMTWFLIDIDFFKRINDNEGHSVGDVILRELAKVICDSVDDGIVSRWGGEEFVVVLDNNDAPFEKAERIRKTIASHDFVVGEKVLHCTVSIGVATLKENEIPDVIALFEEADKHLYDAKNNGRNRVVYL